MNELKPLPVEDIEREIKNLARDYADRVNPIYKMACVYTHPETGEHCIVGQALTNLGLPCPTPGERDDYGDDPNSTGFRQLEWFFNRHGYTRDGSRVVRDWISDVQAKADMSLDVPEGRHDPDLNGPLRYRTWGEAVEAAG